MQVYIVRCHPFRICFMFCEETVEYLTIIEWGWPDEELSRPTFVLSNEADNTNWGHALQFRDPGQRGTGTKPGVFRDKTWGVEQKASFSHVREG